MWCVRFTLYIWHEFLLGSILHKCCRHNALRHCAILNPVKTSEMVTYSVTTMKIILHPFPEEQSRWTSTRAIDHSGFSRGAQEQQLTLPTQSCPVYTITTAYQYIIIIIISGFGIYGAAVVLDSGVGNTWQRLTLVLHEFLSNGLTPSRLQ